VTKKEAKDKKNKKDTLATEKENETVTQTAAADDTVDAKAAAAAADDEKEEAPDLNDALVAENEALKAELEQCKADLDEKADQLLRLSAEFDNFRRRTLKEKDDLRLTANADLLQSLLPVLDNLDRALVHAENSPMLEGILMVQKQLADILNNCGLQKIGEAGEAFDPKIHDGIMQEEKEGATPDTILEVLQPGYQFHDKLLRAAMVKVAK
jgi:molecular chaperone GrpE